MRYGITLTSGDPRELAEMAEAAERAGWDAVFYFDAIAIPGMQAFDSWVAMAAMAMRTNRVRIGALLTPPSRRRPWKLARETMSLDRLSGGRLVLPVGLGALDDLAFGNVGEPTEARTRAELMDEALAILEGLWSGEPFGFDGRHYRFEPMHFLPTPVQRPRIPIWVVGVWPIERTMRRALRWDGIVTQARDERNRNVEVTPEIVRSIAEYAAREHAGEDSPSGNPREWEIVVQGKTPANDRDAAGRIAAPYAKAGATWWIEEDWTDTDRGRLQARIAAGPPAAPHSVR